MQRFHAFQVATKDRPKTFRVVVYSLFSISVFVVVAFLTLQVQSQLPEARPVPTKTAVHSKPATLLPSLASMRR